jgi:cytochrome c5
VKAQAQAQAQAEAQAEADSSGASQAQSTEPTPESVTPAPVETAEEEAQPTARSGAEVYRAACFACHETGVARAPRLGNHEDWSYRINYGIDTMYRSALKGRAGMPAKGGHSELSDDEVRSAVDFMLGQLK